MATVSHSRRYVWYYRSLRSRHRRAHRAISGPRNQHELIHVRFANQVDVGSQHKLTIYRGFMHLAAGMSVGLTGVAAGYTIGIVGDAVRTLIRGHTKGLWSSNSCSRVFEHTCNNLGSTWA